VKNLNLRFEELVHHLDVTSTDPAVRRLIDMLHKRNVTNDLVDVGMDPETQTFEYDGYYHSPAELIEKLRNEIDYHVREIDEWDKRYLELQNERDQLKSRSVVELLSNMEALIRRAESDRDQAHRITESVRQKNKDLEEKINVWTILEKT
jgi:hypothetical protein